MNPPPPAAATLDKPGSRDKRAGPRRWALALLALTLIGVVWGSLAPSVPSLRVNQIDKVQHFSAYAALAGLAFGALRRRSWAAAAALIALGVGVEFAQAALAQGRDGSALDVLANSAGVLLVALAWGRLGLGRRSESRR